MNTLKNPTVQLLTDPIGLDKAIQDVQILLRDNLPWLQKSFGRAKKQPRKDGKMIRREPMVYISNGEYYPTLPNDALTSYSFFRVVGSRDYDDASPAIYTLYETTRVDVIFWVNLKQLDLSIDNNSTEKYINESGKLLNSASGVDLIRIFDEDAREIFEGYTLKEEQRDLLMYPYAAWRFELELRYQNYCQ